MATRREDFARLKAIDMHVHTEVSCHDPKIAQVRYANGQLGHKFLFGSDFPLIPPDKWIGAFDEAGFKPQVRTPILKDNAMALLFGGLEE